MRGLLKNFKVEYGRYIILGSIDGILAILGVIVATYNVSSDNVVIVSAGFGGAFALAMTNGVGSYLAEGTVEYGRLSRLERPLLKSLKNTRLEKETKKKIRIDSLLHGVSSFIGSMIPLFPFLFLSAEIAIYLSIVGSVIALIALGIFSGMISKQSLLMSAAKMVGLGLMIVFILSITEIHP
jgi:predicted membrane protein (TIGR00267 family)